MCQHKTYAPAVALLLALAAQCLLAAGACAQVIGTTALDPLVAFAPSSSETLQVARWVLGTRDHGGLPFVIVDKRLARVYAFESAGQPVGDAPALLGRAKGDDDPPELGSRPLNQIPEALRITPAGRFAARIGRNIDGEDVVWIDYDAALSMHRVVTGNPAEQRLRRLQSPHPEDRRISYGCINLPADFYEHVLAPLVRRRGAVVYVLPETRTAGEVFDFAAPAVSRRRGSG